MPLSSTESTVRLTPRQLELLRMIAEYQQSRCYSPTLAEMAAALNISRSTVFEHIAELRKKGLLSGSPNKARSLKADSKAFELLDFCSETEINPCSGRSDEIPLAGQVAAGLPVEAVENTDSLSLNSCFGSGEDIFALEVNGQSMIGEDIQPGDYVICRRGGVAHDGQLVIAVVDEENATLKRFYKEKSRVRLEPANDDFQPIYSDNCRIEAVVIGLVRKF
ncbi:MAG: repressor LexA [Sedimentisphaerales bacterium]|nr:repressor LexA [Sedimentisphaerales bacterium]